MLNIIHNIAEDGSCEILDLYTRYEDSAWHIAAASERDRFCVTNRNTIVEEGSDSAFSSTRVFYNISKWQLDVIDAYKTENGKNYKMKSYTADEESGVGYSFTWEESEEKGDNFAYQSVQFRPISEFEEAEPVLLKVYSEGCGQGQIAGTDDATKPEFDPEFPMQSASTDKRISIEVNEPLELVAVFKAKGDDSQAANIASDFDIADWAEKDYEDKTKTNVTAEIREATDEVYEIAILDQDGNTLDTYYIDPKTSTGKNSADGKIDLPQTGMSGVHKTVAGLAALMCIAGIGLVKKSKKEDK